MTLSEINVGPADWVSDAMVLETLLTDACAALGVSGTEAEGVLWVANASVRLVRRGPAVGSGGSGRLEAEDDGRELERECCETDATDSRLEGGDVGGTVDDLLEGGDLGWSGMLDRLGAIVVWRCSAYSNDG